MNCKTYIATIQIIIHPDEDIGSSDEACDWITGLFSEDSQMCDRILDWGYINTNGKYGLPTEITIDSLEKYTEGEAIN